MYRGATSARGVDNCLNEEIHLFACNLSPEVDDGARIQHHNLGLRYILCMTSRRGTSSQLAAGMLGDLFSPGDFGASDGGGFKDEGGGKPGITLPEFRPTGESLCSPYRAG